MQVLIVDDNASMRTLLTALLGGRLEVVGALEDGNAVMDAVRRHRPRIVCLRLPAAGP